MDKYNDPSSQVDTIVQKSGILLKMAQPDIYLINAFRILGLPVTALPKEISSRIRTLDLIERYGSGEQTDSSVLSLTLPTDSNIRKKAQQRLQDPELRFIDEFFWFWPLSPHLGEDKDEALAAMEGGDLASASSIWQRHELEGSEANISMHNLAVLYHIQALDLERLEVKRKPSSEQIEEKRLFWEQAFTRWHMLLDDDGFWERVRVRLHELDDPRLTTGTVRRIREGLPIALLSINAILAVEAAEMDDREDAIYHLQLMKHPNFTSADINEALHGAVGPIRDRIRAIATYIKEESGKVAERDDQLAKELIGQAYPLLKILDMLLHEGDATKESAHDEVALQVRSCITSFYNSTQNCRSTLELAKRANAIALSPSIRELIDDDIEAIKGIIEYSTCWFCKKTPAEESSFATVHMHGNVHRFGGQVSWQKLDVPVPRCKACKSLHDRTRYMGYAGVIIGIILAIIIGTASENALIGFIIFIAFGIGGVVLARLIVPKGLSPESHKEKFSKVRELISYGWEIGEKPAGVQ